MNRQKIVIEDKDIEAKKYNLFGTKGTRLAVGRQNIFIGVHQEF